MKYKHLRITSDSLFKRKSLQIPSGSGHINMLQGIVKADCFIRFVKLNINEDVNISKLGVVHEFYYKYSSAYITYSKFKQILHRETKNFVHKYFVLQVQKM